MAAQDNYSTIVSIIYFSINVAFMFGLAFFVYQSGDYEELKSKSYLKDVWSQRKIFTPLLIHFYDTATDIGVIFNWAQLMRQEKSIDFETVDMTTFFWCGVAFLIVYRVCLLCYALYEWCDGDGEWYYLLLILLDLYIFVVVYESFNEAQGIITQNVQKRAANKVKKKKKAEIKKKLDDAVEAETITQEEAKAIKSGETDQIQMSNAATRLMKTIKEIEAEEITINGAPAIESGLQKEKIEEVEPAEKQIHIQLMEAITESMPQIILQSVFLIRSQNDTRTDLRENTNLGLIMFSVLASLFSISSKYSWYDK
eukprot:6441_1